ncbi:MAG TPA: DUF971 domain-containing protein [Pyrinomonadaceae bacterium]|nr:DUF971 domain-containing protein [Pyrinomonadaceae bacterium]
MSAPPRRGPAVEPREIMQESDAVLRVTWGDGRVCRFEAPALRRLCPCAQCVNEFTGERVLRADSVADDLEIADVEIVGRYALTFRWTDGHSTGIYSFRYLREICEGQEEARG